MTKNDIVNVIDFLSPNCEYYWMTEDFKDFVWLEKDKEQPTLSEIEKSFVAYKKSLTEAEAAKAAEKAALLAKLGITEDEAKLLLS